MGAPLIYVLASTLKQMAAIILTPMRSITALVFMADMVAQRIQGPRAVMLAAAVQVATVGMVVMVDGIVQDLAVLAALAAAVLPARVLGVAVAAAVV